MQLLKAAGLPNCGRPSASFSHKRPTAAIGFGQFAGCARHGAQAGGIGHRAVLEEHQIAVIQRQSLQPYPAARQWMPVTVNLPSSVL